MYQNVELYEQLDRYEIPVWAIAVVAFLMLAMFFVGMYGMTVYKKRNEKDLVKRNQRNNDLIYKHASETERDIILFIEDLLDEYLDYDKSNINQNVAQLKKEAKQKIQKFLKTDEMAEFKLSEINDELQELLVKMSEQSFTVWHNFVPSELERITNNVNKK